MRHGNHNRKFGRTKDQRTALLRSLARNLVIKGKITTTEARAKEIRPLVEKMVTRGKSATLANRRMLAAQLGDATVTNKLIKTASNYTARQGGYLRITKMGPRKGDGAAMAVIEFV
jgi:large subunit ribosomal protein L17